MITLREKKFSQLCRTSCSSNDPAPLCVEMVFNPDRCQINRGSRVARPESLASSFISVLGSDPRANVADRKVDKFMKPQRSTGLKLLHSRRGFTLVEILLVLAVLAVFAGMTVPAVMRMFGQQKLTGSAERVRSAIASARIRAIESGLMYQFCCEQNGSRFVVVPYELDYANPPQGGQATGSKTLGRASGFLPKTILFSSVMVRSAGTLLPATSSYKLSPQALDGLPNASDLASVNWCAPILFHPEGSANVDAEITLSDAKSQEVQLRIRAFTGAVAMERLTQRKR